MKRVPVGRTNAVNVRVAPIARLLRWRRVENYSNHPSSEMMRWRKLLLMSASDLQVLGQALVVLPIVAAGLRLFGMRRMMPVIKSLSVPRRDLRINEEESARRITYLVKTAANHGPYTATCLPLSLTLWWLLRRRGIESNIRIGVRMVDGCLAAHAWVEHNGAALNEVTDVRKRYSTFDAAVDNLPINHLE